MRTCLWEKTPGNGRAIVRALVDLGSRSLTTKRRRSFGMRAPDTNVLVRVVMRDDANLFQFSLPRIPRAYIICA